MKKRMALLETVGVMAAIFFFSSQPAEVSGALSNSVEQTLYGTGAECFIPEWFSPNSFANVRKWAHVYIFLALGVCMACTVQAYMASIAPPMPAKKEEMQNASCL